jgi:hypothetical protein
MLVVCADMWLIEALEVVTVPAYYVGKNSLQLAII